MGDAGWGMRGVPDVLILVGSESDKPRIEPAFEVLSKAGVSYEFHVSSAHRQPDQTAKLVSRRAPIRRPPQVDSGRGGDSASQGARGPLRRGRGGSRPHRCHPRRRWPGRHRPAVPRHRPPLEARRLDPAAQPGIPQDTGSGARVRAGGHHRDLRAPQARPAHRGDAGAARRRAASAAIHRIPEGQDQRGDGGDPARGYGPPFFAGPIGRRLMPPHVLQHIAAAYHRHGLWGIFLSRLLPVWRAVVPPFAGIAQVPAARALVPMAVASGLWYGAITFLVAALGTNFEEVLAALGRVNRVLGAAAVLLLVALGLWLSRRLKR